MSTSQVVIQRGGIPGTRGDAGASVTNLTPIYHTGNSIVQAPGMVSMVQTIVDSLNGETEVPQYWGNNLGESGARPFQITADIVQRAAAGDVGYFELLGPYFVNGVRYGDDEEEMKDSFLEAVAALRAAGVERIGVLLDTPWKNYVDPGDHPAKSWDSAKQAITVSINNWLLTLVGLGTVEWVVDLYSNWGDSPTDPAMLKPSFEKLVDPDHLHGNQAAQTSGGTLALNTIDWETNPDIGLNVGSPDAFVNQNVGTNGSPIFNKGLAVGRNISGHPGRSTFHVRVNHLTSEQGIGIGRNNIGDRKVELDVTWGVEWNWANGDFCGGMRVPQSYWGSGGYGGLALRTATGGVQQDSLRLLPSGRVTVSTGVSTDASEDGDGLFSVNNGMDERYYIRPGTAAGGGADQISHIAYHKTNAVYVTNAVYAIQHNDNIGTGPGTSLNGAGWNTWVQLRAATAGLDIGTPAAPFDDAYVTTLTVGDLAIAAQFQGFTDNAAQRGGDFRNTAAAGGTALFAAHGATVATDAKLISAYNLTTSAFVAHMLGNGDWQNTNGVYATISDREVKTNFAPASSQIEDVRALANLMQKYQLKEDVKFAKRSRMQAPFHLGLVAQDVDGISPGLVYEAPQYDMVEREVEVTVQVPVHEYVRVEVPVPKKEREAAAAKICEDFAPKKAAAATPEELAELENAEKFQLKENAEPRYKERLVQTGTTPKVTKRPVREQVPNGKTLLALKQSILFWKGFKALGELIEMFFDYREKTDKRIEALEEQLKKLKK